MGIHTPIDRHFRFGELYGIRESYDDVVRSVEESRAEDELYGMMLKHMVESGDLDKIQRFAAKNARLRDFAIENSIGSAINVVAESIEGLCLTRGVRRGAERRLREYVLESVRGIEPKPFRFMDVVPPPSIAESDEDDAAALQGEQSDAIDRLISNVSMKRGSSVPEIVQSAADAEFERGTDTHVGDRHNYSIRSVVLESIASNERKTELIPPTTLYAYGGTNQRDYLDSTFKSVVGGVNAICGLNFSERDYIWLASGRPQPFLKSEMVITSDAVKGSKMLNAYFGPAGEFKDYLYRADNTPRLEPSKAGSMSEIDREVNVILAYPIIKVYATVVSWDVVNGEERLREITAEDFRGTDIRYVD